MSRQEPPTYLVSFFLNPTDEKVASYVPMTALPSPGLRIVTSNPGHPVFEVTHVQLHMLTGGLREQDSIMYADALVVPSHGIHPDHQEDRD